MSLMSSLYTGVSGLSVNQRGLNATAHNLSNVETDGYVRQQTLFTDSYYTPIGMNSISYLQVGYGATAQAIKQVRDVFLDKSYRQELGRQMFYESQYDAAQEVEDILGETEGVAFQDSVEDLWIALSELCKEPEKIEVRSSFIQTAASFIERAEIIYDQIEEYQISLNKQIETYVNRINTIGDQIQDLNSKIQLYEANKVEKANDLRDARNLLLDELGGIAAITYKETATGVVTVMLEDYPFVTEDTVYHIGTRKLDGDTQMIEPYWPSYGGEDVFKFEPLPNSVANTDIGALKGLLLARGEKVGKYTDIPKEPVKADYTDAAGDFDKDAYDLACRTYKEDLENFNKTIDCSAVVSVQAQFDQLIHGIVTMINDAICPNKQVVNSEGETITIFDEENAPVGMDDEFTPGEAIFNRKSMSRYEKTTETIEVDGVWQEVEVWKYNEEDATNNYSLFTLGEIEVNPKILKEPSLIPLSENTKTGDYSVKICEDLLTAWQTPFSALTPNEYTINNINDYYTEMIGALGTRGEKFKNVSESQDSLVNSIDNQRLSLTAVSSDEELTNMIKFQQGYNASARYINVVSEMLDHLLSTLGR